MDWSEVRPALKTAAQEMTGLFDFGKVEWRGANKAGYVRQYPRIDLSIRSIAKIGIDEARPSFEGDTQEMNLCGHRSFVWSIRIESEQQTDSGQAFVYADRVMTRINRSYVKTTLNDAGLSIATIEDAKQIDFVLQDRSVSVVVIDVHMNWVAR